MNFLPISDSAARQSIDAVNIWTEYLRAKTDAAHYTGGMYWKREGGYVYLVKTLAGNKQHRLGPQTEETEQVFAAFHARKKAAEARLSSLSEALDETQRLNKAVRAGRVPDIVVQLLNALEDAGLAWHLRVVGTHALFAYESNAGVRIGTQARDTKELDPLWGAKRGVEFLLDADCEAGSVLAVMQRVDRSFRLRTDASMSGCAINGSGFEVQFWRLGMEPSDRDAAGLSEADGHARAMRTQIVAVLSHSHLFSQPVIAATGKMATMRTIDPQTFVAHKCRLAGFEAHDAVTRQRDALQAAIVQEMLQTKMLSTEMD